MPAIPEYFQRIGQKPKYPELWDGCVGAWASSLGATGGTLFDMSGYGNHGILTNSTNETAWGADSAVVFDGADDFINLGGNPLLQPTGTVSYMAWIRVTNHTLFGMLVTAGPANTSQLRFNAASGRVHFISTIGGVLVDQSVYTTFTVLSTGVWYHVAGVYDGTKIAVYVNGVYDGGYAVTGAAAAASGVVRLGARADGYYFNGKMDDIRIYTTAVTPEAVREMYRIGRGGSYATRARRTFYFPPAQQPVTSYFANQYFPNDYFPKEYFPHETVTIPRYFPAAYFPNSYFPQRYFPHKLKTPITTASLVDTPTLGGAAVTAGGAQIQPAGRASTAAFGAQQINRRIAGAGLNATQSFGTDSIRRLLALTSVAGAAQYGAHKLNRSISPSGLLDTQSFGTDIIRRYVTAAGVAAAQSFGTTSLRRQVAVTGRASTVAAGNAAIAGGALSVICTGLSPVTGFGTTNIRRLIAAAGFATPQSLGTPAVRRRVTATGLAATQTFGADAIARRIYAAGLSATQSFGVAQIRYRITVPGVSPHAALGNSAIQGETQFLICSGVAVAEGFGAPAIPRRLNISALSGQSQTGVSSVSRKLLLPGVARTGNIGSVTVPRLLRVPGIATSNAIPQPQLRRRLQTVSLPSGVAFGQFRVRLFLLPAGFVDPPQVGQWSLQVRILPTGVLDVAEFGNPELDRYLAVYGFAVGATYGTLQLVGASAPGIYGDDVVQNIWQGAF